MSLSDDDRTVLLFAARRWQFAGARDTAIREEFGISPVQYEQRLLAVIDKPEAYIEQPVLVKRLRRLRAERRARRAG